MNIETSVEQNPTVWNHVIIDLPGRRVFADERVVNFRGESVWWILLHLAESGSMPLSKEDLEPVARKAGAEGRYPLGSSITHLRKLFKDSRRSLIRGDVRSGLWFGASDIGYVGYAPERYGWSAVATPARGVRIEETGVGLNINDRVVYLEGKQRELVKAVPNTGMHFILAQDLAYVVYGDRGMTHELLQLVNVTNKRKLRPNRTEIAYLKGTTPYNPTIIGYYHTVLVERNGHSNPEPQIPQPEWQLEGIDEIYQRAFLNATEWLLSQGGPFWPKLIEGIVTEDMLDELRILGKPRYKAYTPDELIQMVWDTYVRLNEDGSNMDSWPENFKRAWRLIQRFKERMNTHKESMLRGRITQTIKRSYRNYESLQAALQR